MGRIIALLLSSSSQMVGMIVGVLKSLHEQREIFREVSNVPKCFLVIMAQVMYRGKTFPLWRNMADG